MGSQHQDLRQALQDKTRKPIFISWVAPLHIIFKFKMRGLSLLLPSLVFATKEQVTFTLGSLGEITGDTVQTKIYENAPHNNRPYYRFRNIPYAQPFQRFFCLNKVIVITSDDMKVCDLCFYLVLIL